MFRCLFWLALISWCFLCTTSLPARRVYRLYRPRYTAPPADLDQTAEASSLVDDFVPQQENHLADGRHFTFDFQRLYPLHKPHFSKKECLNCNTDDRIVTLGESRSYSVVTNPRTETTNAPSTSEGTTEVTVTETMLDTTTTEMPSSTEYFRVSPAIDNTQYSSSEPASLLTEDKPFATAVQRSQFSVEEAVHEPLSLFQEKSAGSQTSYNVKTTETPPQPSLPTGPYRYYPTPVTRIRSEVFPRTTTLNSVGLSETGATDPHEIRIVESSSSAVNPLTSPVSYHTSLKSPTSGSTVSFFKHAPVQAVSASTEVPITTLPTERLRHETRVETVSFHHEVVVPQRATEKVLKQTVNAEKSYQFTNVHQDKSFSHVQVTHLEASGPKKVEPYTARSQEERVYGMPEQNYEVDEALSVQTNGRAHGVQGSPATGNKGDGKSGYVVEGRNFKKYRVEERTSDGFIVGEYGVVRNDDGSLRGVRYTADSTINPRLIHEALVKFLSLR